MAFAIIQKQLIACAFSKYFPHSAVRRKVDYCFSKVLFASVTNYTKMV